MAACLVQPPFQWHRLNEEVLKSDYRELLVEEHSSSNALVDFVFSRTAEETLSQNLNAHGHCLRSQESSAVQGQPTPPTTAEKKLELLRREKELLERKLSLLRRETRMSPGIVSNVSERVVPTEDDRSYDNFLDEFLGNTKNFRR
ncbi:hypothetical protein KM043_011448 [Ampulex compressa]|nr:hypothetical protein KM043_011448 [Ampulex compressa]